MTKDHEHPVPVDEPERVERWHGFQLSEFQVEAVHAVRMGRNVLVSAPTGAGKTLVAEYALHDAVARGKRCVYTAPIKALSNQKYRDFRAAGVDVGLMTGDVTLQPEAQVLIMTTEILRNAIFEDPEGLSDVEYVIFDEVHFLDDPERGTVWEESLIFAPRGMRFICLSATIANIDELGAWIGEIREHELQVIRSERRPVPLEHRVWSATDGLIEEDSLRQAVKRAGKRAKAEAERESRGRGKGRGKGGRSGRGRRPRPKRFEMPDPTPLFDDLQHEGLLPVLVFAFSRKDCARLARRNEGRNLLDADEHERMLTLQEELIETFRLPRSALSGEVFTMGRNGIGYHHAGLLPVDKELVERMFTSGLLKMVFTTETFALGINMPARTVVFHALKKFDGVSVDWLRTREYMQMAGRAGRQGLDDAGLVVSILGDKELSEAPFERLQRGRPEPVVSRFALSYSSLLHLVADLGRTRLHLAWEQSFRLFQLREESDKTRARNVRRHRRHVEARLALLSELGYLDEDDQLTGRGRLARRINGYEIQITELCFSGMLENLPPTAMAVIFVGLIYEERRRGGGGWVPDRHYGSLRKRIGRFLARVAGREAHAGVEPPMKPIDWGLTEAVVLWAEGAPFEALEEAVEVGPGDLVRTFRMALQLMRQLRRAIEPSWDLHAILGDAMAVLDRDEVDARAQLELG